MSQTRKAAVSGLFYPDDPATLKMMIEDLLGTVKPLPNKFRAIITPHAGYIYSGETAAHAYKPIESLKNQIKRIILFGPAHRVPFSGIAASSADFFETPLGSIPLDTCAINKLHERSLIQLLDSAHEQEHSLEVQLPFLQTVLNDFTLVPLVVGDTQASKVTEIIDYFWHDTSTFFLISSDLSHFHDYQLANTIDRQTANAIMAMKPNKIDYDHACGRTPVNGLLNFARTHHLKPTLLDLRNSGDTAGDHQRVVGYGAFGFE